MNKRYFAYSFLWVSGLLAMMLAGCNKTSNSTGQEKEEIQNYITQNSIIATANKDGLYYVSKVEGTGNTPVANNWILYDYQGYYMNSGNLFDSSDTAQASVNGVVPYYELGGPVKSVILSSTPNWLEGFLNMKEGGYASFIIPSSMWNSDGQPRIINVHLIKVIPDLRKYEMQQITSFIDSVDTAYNLHYTIADTTSGNGNVNGIYYLETQAGTGNAPVNLNTVNVTYTMKLIDGKLVQTYNGSYQLGQGFEISGIEQGIKEMKTGSKGYIILPYHTAYNGNAIINNYTGQVLIQPFSTLIVEIKLNSFQ